MDNLSEKIKQLRNEYSDSDFLIEHLDKNPLQQFTNWLDDAIETNKSGQTCQPDCLLKNPKAEPWL